MTEGSGARGAGPGAGGDPSPRRPSLPTAPGSAVSPRQAELRLPSPSLCPLPRARGCVCAAQRQWAQPAEAAGVDAAQRGHTHWPPDPSGARNTDGARGQVLGPARQTRHGPQPQGHSLSDRRVNGQVRQCGVGAVIGQARGSASGAACGAWGFRAGPRGTRQGWRVGGRDRRAGGGLLLVRDYGGGQLLVVASQDALSGLEQGDPAAGLQGLGTLVDDHYVEAAVGQQLQGAVVGGAWRKSGP